MNKQKAKDFILHKFLKQYKLGWIGGFKDILTMVIFYMSIISFTLVAVTAYNTGLREWLLIYFPWMKIYIFYGILLAIAGIAMVLEYKFVYPSFYAFRSQQEYKHQSPLRADLALCLKKLDEISEEIKKLKGESNIEKEDGE
jgi:hypothetical protein